MNEIMSKVLYSQAEYSIWFSKGDILQYRITDSELDGVEIYACKTLKQAKRKLQIYLLEHLMQILINEEEIEGV